MLSHPSRRSFIKRVFSGAAALAIPMPVLLRDRVSTLRADPASWSILPAGATKPQGWIRNQIRTDLRDGLTGHYDRISGNVTKNLFVRKNRIPGTRVTTELRGKEKAWWAGEHEGYWKDAVLRSAYLVDDSAYLEQARSWMEAIIESQDDDGYIGIYTQDTRFPAEGFDGELWTQSRIFQPLLAYYQLTGDRRALTAVQRATELTLSKYQKSTYFGRPRSATGGGVAHGVGFMDTLEWLYRLTGNDEYLRAAVWLYLDFSNGTSKHRDLALERLLDDDALWQDHTPHIAEGLHMPEICFAATGDDRFRRAADSTLRKLAIHTNPGGGIVGSESVEGRPGAGDMPGEYCSMTESVITLNRVLAYRNDLSIGDRVERTSLNAAQGARFHPANRATAYLSLDNQKEADDAERYHDRFLYAATHAAADCCSLNSTRLMPYYVEGMWYRAAGDTLVANLYGPSNLQTSVAGTRIEIEQRTEYPFSDEVVFDITTERPVVFDLVLRIPDSRNNARINTGGAYVVERSRGHVRLRKEWQTGDRVAIDFRFEVERRMDNRGEAYYVRGPLVFALPFPAEKEAVKQFATDGEGGGFHRYLLRPAHTRGWNYRVDPQAAFERVTLPDGDPRSPWAHPPLGLRGTMLDSSGSRVEVTLVPEGSTLLRRVTFPLAA